MLGYTARWVRTIVQRWNQAGESGIGDRRLQLPGAPCLLTREHQQELDHALDQPPADGGLWSGPKVAAWMAERLGRPVDPRRGWDYLQRLGRSTRVPRPQHEQSDAATQQAFKKTARGGPRAAEAYPEARIELWSQDEHRIGLKPILRRVWARKGSRVRAVVRQRYQWMDLYGFVQPPSGRTSWLLMPTVNTTAFSLALRHSPRNRGWGQTNTSSWFWIKRAGTRVLICRFLTGCTCCSCRRTRPSSNRQNAYGRSQMNRSPTGSWLRLTNWNSCRPSAVVGYKRILK